MAWARGTMVATSRYSSGLCALPPTGPTAQEIDAVRAHIVVRCRGAEVDELMGMLGLSGEPD